MISSLPTSLSPASNSAPYAIVASETATKLLSQQEIQNYAKNLLVLFEDGFQWKDLAEIITVANSFLSNLPSLTLDEKRVSVIQILNNLVDLTDTPSLPDDYTDFLFKAMIPPFVRLLISEKTVDLIPFGGSPSAESIREAVHNSLNAFKDGFQWKDLASVCESGMFFASQFYELTGEDKAAIAKEFIDFVIDETDTPYMIDSFSDPIFKKFIHPVIDIFFQEN